MFNKNIHDERFETYRHHGIDHRATNKAVRKVYQAVGKTDSTKSIIDKHAHGLATDDIHFLSRHIARMNARGHTACLYTVFILMMRDLKKYGSAHGPKLDQIKEKYDTPEKIRQAAHTTCTADKLIQEINEEHERRRPNKKA